MSIRFLKRNLVARHNQLLRVKSNGQPLERSQVPHPSRCLRRVGSYPQTARSSAPVFFRCRITSPLPPPQRCSSPLFSNQRATKIVVILRASDKDARRTSISAPRKIQPRLPLRLLAAICFLSSLDRKSVV